MTTKLTSRALLFSLVLLLASPAISQQPESQARRAAAIADYRRSCAPQIAIYIGEKAGRSTGSTDYLFTHYRSANYNTGENGMLMGPQGLRSGLDSEIAGAARFNDKSRLGICVFQVALRHAQQGVPGFDQGAGAPQPRSRIASRPNVAAKPTPPRPSPVAKLPPARPAKMVPWSPKSMSTNPKRVLSPRFASERADALASCSGPLQQFSSISEPDLPIEETRLLFEAEFLQDEEMKRTPTELHQRASYREAYYSANPNNAGAFAQPVAKCLYRRRIAQLEGSPLAPAAVDGTLTPLSIGSGGTQWKQRGKDARIIASDGKSAMHCVRLDQLSSGDSGVSGGGQRLFNGCTEEVEITWCNTPRCGTPAGGNTWTVQAGRGWPVSADGEVRWAACLGRDTAAFVTGSHGLRYYCSAPARK